MSCTFGPRHIHNNACLEHVQLRALLMFFRVGTLYPKQSVTAMGSESVSESERVYMSIWNSIYFCPKIIFIPSKCELLLAVCSILRLCARHYGDHSHGVPKIYDRGFKCLGHGFSSYIMMCSFTQAEFEFLQFPKIRTIGCICTSMNICNVGYMYGTTLVYSS